MSLAVSIRHQIGGFALDAAFAVDAPGVVALFGPSGAGKSTILQAVAGLIRPRRGRIAIDGEVLFDSESGIDLPARRRRIGVVFQDARLFPHLSVRANLLYGARRSGTGSAGLPGIADLLGLAPLLDRRPAGLSGGERQRVALGRALLAGPRLLLLDEPLASLDLPRRREILPYLERLRDEARVPMLYVSHSLDEVARLADHVVLLRSGSVAGEGPVFDVLSSLGPEFDEEEEPGVVLPARLAVAEEDGLTGLDFAGGRLWVPVLRPPPVGTLRVRVRARDVMIALREPEGISALNVIPCRVIALAPAGEGQVDATLEAGAAMLRARLTRRSAERLDLRPGLDVHSVIKAVSVDRRRGGGRSVP